MEKNTILSLQKKKKEHTPIVALTCYDAASARLIDSWVDIALVGDSLANTRLGYKNTLPITMNEMVHHVRAASRGISDALLVADMPFHSYEAAPWQAAVHAGRFIKEGRAQAIKLEGGKRVAPSIQAILKANIPVMGHLGLMPQSIHKMGGYHVQGKSPKEANELLKEAKLLESLGVFAIVLEGIPRNIAQKISTSLKIPTIGIGAGPGCDGQILVLDDMLGISQTPLKFVRRYANLYPLMKKALKNYRDDVLHRQFPSDAESYH